METAVALPPDIATNPAWYMLDYSSRLNYFTFTLLEQAQYNKFAFLDKRTHELFRQTERVAFDRVESAFSDTVDGHPSAYIFQIGHCGSTLLSRALGQCAGVLSVREPLPLRTLAYSGRELDVPLGWLSPEHWERLKVVVLRALDRRFRPDQVPIIKATSTCNNLIDPILASHPGRRAILLHQKLETTLAGMLRSPSNRADLRKQARHRLQEWHLLTRSTDIRLKDVSDVDIVVLSWAGSMTRFLLAETRFPGQAMKLDFDDFLASPNTKLLEIARFLGLDNHSDRIAGAFETVAQAYSKSPDKPYSPVDRQYHLDLSRSQNVREIANGLRTARSLIESHPKLAALGKFLGD